MVRRLSSSNERYGVTLASDEDRGLFIQLGEHQSMETIVREDLGDRG